MKKYLFVTVLFTVISLTISAQVDDSKSRAILDKVAAKTKTYKNMRFDFTYIMIDKKNKVNDTLKGKITMSSEKYNLDFMNRKIISDGKTVWTYDPDAEEIQISNVKKDQDAFNPSKLITGYDKSFRTRLIKTITEKGRQYHIIDLYPKKGKQYYKIRLKIDKKLMRVVRGTVYNKDNVTYTYIVDRFEHDVTLPENYFKLNPKDYPDAEVVDLR